MIFIRGGYPVQIIEVFGQSIIRYIDKRQYLEQSQRFAFMLQIYVTFI